VPVDGGYTMDIDTMAGVITDLRARLILPMHWFSGRSLEVFLARAAGRFDVVETGLPEIEVSRARLPARPTIVVLSPALLP